MPTISAHGLTADLPAGWDGEIYVRPAEPAGPGFQSGNGGIENPVLQLANFPLPAQRGDFGSGAVEIMGSGGVFLALFEHEPAAAATALFATVGAPWPLPADAFDPNQMQRPLPGQTGAQWFFTVNGRPFCLYAALGSHRMRAVLVRQANQLLSTVVIS